MVMTFLEHLDELRRRSIISLAALVICALLFFPLSEQLLHLLKIPAGNHLGPLVYFSPEEALVTYMRLSFFGGFIVCLPILLSQIWAFLAPALPDKMRARSVPVILAVSSLFLAGVIFAYEILLPSALQFLLSFSTSSLVPTISVGKYISFVLGFLLACGTSFQMPLLIGGLTYAGIITPVWLIKNFKLAVIGLLILSAFLTPTTDAFNMLLLAGPLIGLYAASILLSRLIHRSVYPAHKEVLS
jgi:sec-independent protein translocase protein TatC